MTLFLNSQYCSGDIFGPTKISTRGPKRPEGSSQEKISPQNKKTIYTKSINKKNYKNDYKLIFFSFLPQVVNLYNQKCKYKNYDNFFKICSSDLVKKKNH